MLGDTHYCGDENVQKAAQRVVELVGPVGGSEKSKEDASYERLTIDDFDIDEHTEEVKCCPAGHTPDTSVQDEHTGKTTTVMPESACSQCDFCGQCPIEKCKRQYRLVHTANQRLAFHQAQSGPKMEALKAWLAAQIEERKVEPNSGLGEAITYMRKHWDKLTLFLRQPAAPLDNNVCEQALKKTILHRKNAYFYKTENGARVGDLFMNLIHTCELNGINPFEYLTQLNKHADELAAAPADWMPWTYRNTLAMQAAPQSI